VADPSEASWSGHLIDLHAHTTASDGTLTPGELVALAKRVGLDALAITDHDTFAGYEEALSAAAEAGLDLIRGIELNSKLDFTGMSVTRERQHRSVHLLGYWPSEAPAPEFYDWLQGERDDRRDRNRRLAEALQDRGIDITLQEVEARGRSLAGRTHFARILVEKGYARNHEDAFVNYLGEDSPSYVERQSETTENAIDRIRTSGGVPVIAHPVRLSLPYEAEREVLLRLKDAGLLGLEVYHSEHPPAMQAYYRQLAEELKLVPTGGSDFHGGPKPEIQLGTGMQGNLRVPREFLEQMKHAIQ
jgi:3',5'-nucleoside bisphosphate phosphatase